MIKIKVKFLNEPEKIYDIYSVPFIELNDCIHDIECAHKILDILLDSSIVENAEILSSEIEDEFKFYEENYYEEEITKIFNKGDVTKLWTIK